MAKVFGGNGTSSGGPVRSTNSSYSPSSSGSTSRSSNVFNSGGSACFDSGARKVLSVSPEALRVSGSQIFSSTPNVFSEGSSAPQVYGLEDFFTKSEVLNLLKTKADISSVYTEDEVDLALQELESRLNQSLVSFITEPEVNVKISAATTSTLQLISEGYYNKSQVYTKSEVDTLLGAIQVQGDFIRKQPTTTANNTISPGANEAIPLTLVASTDPDITTVQHWIDNQSNSIGRVRTSGRVEFYGHMLLGQNIEAWRAALDVNNKRISGVKDPVDALDAVNKKYVEDYVVEVIDAISQGEDGVYIVDGLTY